MRSRAFLFLATCFFVLPSLALAAASVQINEIAWMGNTASANDEWMELHNSGSEPQDLSGWTLKAADGSPEITLSGVITADGYFLLERSSDETVPNIMADLVYAGALSNSGETLTLHDATGAIVDTVEGGLDWQNIGGENTTKLTAQRLSSGNSWITATGTPKEVNAGQGEVLGAVTTASAGDTAPSSPQSTMPSTGSTQSSTAPGTPTYPRKEISVFAGDDEQVFSGFPVSFLGSAKGLYDEPLEYAAYRWNFGDGATGEGGKATHVYPFPGEYVVVLEAAWGPYKKTDRVIVTVSQPDVSIPRAKSGSEGFIEIANHTNREIDLSGWALRTDTTRKTFLFPENTILLPRKSAIFPNAMTHLGDEGAITLLNPSGASVCRYGEIPVAIAPATGIVKGAATLKPMSALSPGVSNQTDVMPRDRVGESSSSATSSAAATILWERGGEVLEQGQFSSENLKWVFALAGILLIALAGSIIARSRVDEAAISNEYAIIEDIIEGEIKE